MRQLHCSGALVILGYSLHCACNDVYAPWTASQSLEGPLRCGNWWKRNYDLLIYHLVFLITFSCFSLLSRRSWSSTLCSGIWHQYDGVAHFRKLTALEKTIQKCKGESVGVIYSARELERTVESIGTCFPALTCFEIGGWWANTITCPRIQTHN